MFIEHGKGHLPLKDAKEASKLVTMDVERFFFKNEIPFNVAASPSFATMCRSLGDYVRGYNFQVLMIFLLRCCRKKKVETMNKIVEDVKKTWKTTRVTLMSDGWTNIRGRSLFDFIVNNPKGTVFLKSIDASDMVKDADLIFKLLDDIVDEVEEGLFLNLPFVICRCLELWLSPSLLSSPSTLVVVVSVSIVLAVFSLPLHKN
ncbi:hypothetical protein LWI28_027192 [Acer negundo]|uniref:DUF659 domain-containing protein n=1 Tax=Acer negundo TaxID=4023 RepID=A0AAD5JND9_ACENE|nr:hypothetical protein LWI28_027192 [Acer negundo]